MQVQNMIVTLLVEMLMFLIYYKVLPFVQVSYVSCVSNVDVGVYHICVFGFFID